MKKTVFIERGFENITAIATKILGSTLTFLLALILVLYWWSTNLFFSHDIHQNIGDIIFGITFLSLFLIQKSFNRYSALMDLKLNELVASNNDASNAVLNTHKKTESEIIEMVKEYIDEEIEELEDSIRERKDKE